MTPPTSPDPALPPDGALAHPWQVAPVVPVVPLDEVLAPRSEVAGGLAGLDLTDLADVSPVPEVLPPPLPDFLPPSAPYTDELVPWKRLAAAIIEQAVWDRRAVVARGGLAAVRRVAEQHRLTDRLGTYHDCESAYHYFESKGFEGLCRFLGLEPEGIREQMEREEAVTVATRRAQGP
jgi:hypothetical protein